MAVPSASPPLLAVALVFRSRPEFDALGHVISAVSTYVDSSVELPLHKACKFGSVELLNRIWNSTVDLEPGGWGLWSVRSLLRTHKLYGKLQFSLCLLEVAKINSVGIAQWLFDRFPYGVRRKVIYKAAKAGSLDLLHFFLANGTVVGSEEDEDGEWDEETEDWEKGRYVHFGAFDAAKAARAGHTNVAKWLYGTCNEASEMRIHRSVLNAAFVTGNMELAHWIMDHVEITPEGPYAIFGAAANGYVECLQWLEDNGYYTTSDMDTGALIKAAEAGQLKVVQWIIDRDRLDDKLGNESGPDEYDADLNDHRLRRTYVTCLGGEASLAIHVAAINGHLEVAKYLHAIIDKPRTKAEEEAEKHRVRMKMNELVLCFGRGAVLKRVQKVSGETMMLAAERGYLDVVKWIYSEFHTDPTLNLFWIQGHLDENGYSFNEYEMMTMGYCSAVDAAAGKGHLAVVQYLLQVGGKAENEHARKRQRIETNTATAPTTAGCTSVAMDGAAAHGHLNVVQWLHDNCSVGCTTAVMDLAASNGHLETVKWLHANRKEGCTTDAMDGAAASGHLHVVKWLHEHTSEGCTTDAMDRAAGGGHFEILKWLHENRTEGFTVAAMDGAARCGHFDMVKWLHRHQTQYSTIAMDGAASGGHLRVLRWLLENQEEGFTSCAIHTAGTYFQFETLLILHGVALANDIEVVAIGQPNSISDYYLRMTNKMFWARKQ